jgi:hypothetical protein
MAATAHEQTKEKDPHLPPLCRVSGVVAPRAPQKIDAADLGEGELTGLVVRFAYTLPRFSTDQLVKQLHLSAALADDILAKLCYEGQIEQLWQTSQTSSHYRITDQGRQQAERLNALCMYIGPAPVSLEAYGAMLRYQFANSPQVTPEHFAAALSNMVFPEKTVELAGLGASSGRSLFIYGPPGNGKSSLGRLIRDALPGDYWIPYAISVGETIIRMFDPQMHQRADFNPERADAIDQRWVRVKRPLVIVGGELTVEMLDLIYIPSVRFYEAPPHLKANGGVFLVDDFGRERVSPEQLLNRFITPMEHQIDYCSLRTGQKIQVPLRHVLISATNLSLENVTDPAFLRRMGYRLYLGPPTEEEYTKIFRQYAQRLGAQVSQEIIDMVLARYREQKRELRACEPRDIIERSRDICRFRGRPLELTQKVLDLAWAGYFGEQV